MEGFPSFVVDFGFEGSFECLVGVSGTEEVGVAHEETLSVVVSVYEPTGDAVGAVATDFAGVRMEDIDPMHSDLCPVVGGQSKGKVRVSQLLDRSERLSPLSIRPTVFASKSRGLFCSGVTIPNSCARIRKVSVSASEPLAIPRN